MAKSNSFEIDWSKLPEVHQDKLGFWWSGDWTFDMEEPGDIDLGSCEEAVYAMLAWYLHIKEEQSGGAEA